MSQASTVLKELRITPYGEQGGLLRSFSTLGDRVNLMRDLAEINLLVLKRARRWSLEAYSGEQISHLADTALEDIAQKELAMFSMTPEFLNGDSIEGKRDSDSEALENRFLNYQVMNFAMKLIRINEQLARVIFSADDSLINHIMSVSEANHYESLWDSWLTLRPMPEALSADDSVGTRVMFNAYLVYSREKREANRNA